MSGARRVVNEPPRPTTEDWERPGARKRAGAGIGPEAQRGAAGRRARPRRRERESVVGRSRGCNLHKCNRRFNRNRVVAGRGALLGAYSAHGGNSNWLK